MSCEQINDTRYKSHLPIHHPSCVPEIDPHKLEIDLHTQGIDSCMIGRDHHVDMTVLLHDTRERGRLHQRMIWSWLDLVASTATRDCIKSMTGLRNCPLHQL